MVSKPTHFPKKDRPHSRIQPRSNLRQRHDKFSPGHIVKAHLVDFDDHATTTDSEDTNQSKGDS